MDCAKRLSDFGGLATPNYNVPAWRKLMIRLARINVATPGKTFELLAVLKEAAAVVEKVAGAEVTTFGSMGAHVGEFVSVSNYSSLADFEEKSGKLLASKEYQAVVKKLEGLVVPGSAHDHFLRQL
jgi:hypothetical protein